jgi:hypothetical protein
LVHNRIDDAGPVDAELVVVGWFRPQATEPFAVIVNFGAHPTMLGAWNRLLSADYPGVIRSVVQERWPGATVLFFAGAVADQAPTKTDTGFERMEWYGRTLGQETVRLLNRMQPEPATSITAAARVVALPPARVRIGRLVFPRWLGARFVDDDATLSIVRVGRIGLIGVPCDLGASLGNRLKAAARQQRLQPVIVGFANDYIGYCVPEALYHAKRYESSMAFNGPRAGELIVERLLHMLNDIVTRDK